jgi:hypothetical protein
LPSEDDRHHYDADSPADQRVDEVKDEPCHRVE